MNKLHILTNTIKIVSSIPLPSENEIKINLAAINIRTKFFKYINSHQSIQLFVYVCTQCHSNSNINHAVPERQVNENSNIKPALN